MHCEQSCRICRICSSVLCILLPLFTMDLDVLEDWNGVVVVVAAGVVWQQEEMQCLRTVLL